MQLMTRMIVALAVTVLAALALYFVFLHGQPSARLDSQASYMGEAR